MDPHLLDYYNRELTYMRDAAGEFAAAHPKIARRLGMQGTETDDPYVERLIESFSFMSARLQIKLDAEFPRFTERLLEVLYPNYICPTPSMAVAQLHPCFDQKLAHCGATVPRGSTFTAAKAPGTETACQFRSSQDVGLWPIEITDAQLTGVPPELAALASRFAPHVGLAGALRLTLRSTGAGLGFAEMSGLDRLPVYLRGESNLASRLFELLHTAAVGSVVWAPGTPARQAHVVTEGALVHEALEADQGLLPLQWNTFHGHNLLHEFFTCPERFWFFTLTQLSGGLSRIAGQEAEIVVLLNRTPDDFPGLAGLVDVAQFALFCTPVINLFPGAADQFHMTPGQAEHHYVPKHTEALNYEVHSIQSLRTVGGPKNERQEFRPLYETLHDDPGNHGRYFSLRREPRLPSDAARRHGRRAAYVGTEVFLSLVDQHEAPYAESPGALTVSVLLTNRDLPCMVPRNGRSDLTVKAGMPVGSIGLIRPPTAPRPPFAQREMAWRLIRQLGFNHLPLVDLPKREGAQALRDMLRLFVAPADEVQRRIIDSLVASSLTPVTRRLPGAGPLLYGRGVECTLTVDEAGFSGASPYLFGLVLERYISRHVSINGFTQTVLATVQRGTVARWPLRAGGRGIV